MRRSAFTLTEMRVVTRGTRNIALDRDFAAKNSRRSDNPAQRSINNDTVELSDDLRTVYVEFATYGVDEIRIIVQADGGNEEPVTQETPR